MNFKILLLLVLLFPNIASARGCSGHDCGWFLVLLGLLFSFVAWGALKQALREHKGKDFLNSLITVFFVLLFGLGFFYLGIS